MDTQQIGMCGAYCGICEWKEKTNCPGCQACRGDMFYGECGVAKCCHGKGLLHCGLCPDLPCAELQQAFDHPEHGDHGERLANLKNWAKGDDTVIKLGTFPKEGQACHDKRIPPPARTLRLMRSVRRLISTDASS